MVGFLKALTARGVSGGGSNGRRFPGEAGGFQERRGVSGGGSNGRFLEERSDMRACVGRERERENCGEAGWLGGCWAGPSRVGPVVALFLSVSFSIFCLLYLTCLKQN
jgi:hypothetical protein